MGTTTPNLDLYKPTVGETGWGALVDGNFDTVDDLIGNSVHFPTGKVFNLAANGCALDGTTDDSAAVQAVVDAAPHHSVIYHPGGKCKISSTIDFGTKALTMAGPNAYNYRDSTVGSWFMAGTAAMDPMFVSGLGSGGIVQQGVNWVGLGFEDTASTGTSTCHFMRRINRTHFERCTWADFLVCREWDRQGVDCAWNTSAWNNFYNYGTADLFTACVGFRDWGSVGIADQGIFGNCVSGTHLKWFGTMIDGGFPAFKDAGSYNEYHGIKVELGGGAPSHTGWQFTSTAISPRIMGCTVSGSTGAGTNIGIQIDSGAKGVAIIAPQFVGLDTNWTDAGLQTLLLNTSSGTGTFIPYLNLFGNLHASTTKLGFFGASEVVKPTVSGAKGSNAALGSLMTALSNLGLVTDSTSA